MSRKRRERGWWIHEHLPPSSGRLLDVGCHDATDTSDWADRADVLHGIDVDPAIFNGDRLVLRAQASGSALPFRDSVFDVVTCSEVLEHVPIEVERPMIEECRRVIRDDGTFLFTTPHDGWFAWLDPLDTKRRLGLRKGKGHKHYKVEEIETLFHGLFRIEEIFLSSLVLHPISTWLGFGNQQRWLGFRGWLSDWDYQHSFGRASFNMAIVGRPICT